VWRTRLGQRPPGPTRSESLRSWYRSDSTRNSARSRRAALSCHVYAPVDLPREFTVLVRSKTISLRLFLSLGLDHSCGHPAYELARVSQQAPGISTESRWAFWVPFAPGPDRSWLWSAQIAYVSLWGSRRMHQPPEETMTAPLRELVAPMGARFRRACRSLSEFCSCCAGRRRRAPGINALERAEALLSSWLETGLPQQLRPARYGSPTPIRFRIWMQPALELLLAIHCQQSNQPMNEAFSPSR